MKNQETLTPKPSETATERAARMATIRQQLADGTYRVNSDALAEALIQHLQQKDQRRAA